jgi:hypothetical protein
MRQAVRDQQRVVDLLVEHGESDTEVRSHQIILEKLKLALRTSIADDLDAAAARPDIEAHRLRIKAEHDALEAEYAALNE